RAVAGLPRLVLPGTGVALASRCPRSELGAVQGAGARRVPGRRAPLSVWRVGPVAALLHPRPTGAWAARLRIADIGAPLLLLRGKRAQDAGAALRAAASPGRHAARSGSPPGAHQGGA